MSGVRKMSPKWEVPTGVIALDDRPRLVRPDHEPSSPRVVPPSRFEPFGLSEDVGQSVALRRLLVRPDEGRIALDFQPIGELPTTGGDDATLRQDVHVVGVQYLEKTVVVSDGQHADVLLVGQRFDAARAVAQGVDVET